MYKLMSMTKAAIRQLLKPVARKKLLSLTSSSDSDIAKLSSAIIDVLNGRFDANELAWIDKIETTREKLKNDRSIISVTDFGAGKPSDNRTEEEMLTGVNTKLTVADVTKASKPHFWACILFKLVKYYKPVNGLELGSCVGISAAYQAAAQVLNNHNCGKMTTLEGSESVATLAKENIKALGLSNVEIVTGKFNDTLDAVLGSNEKFDYVFIDGHHDEQATLKYFDKIIPRLTERALVIFDDIAWSDGMKRAWQRIIRYENVSVSIDLRTIGICLLRPNVGDRKAYKVNLI